MLQLLACGAAKREYEPSFMIVARWSTYLGYVLQSISVALEAIPSTLRITPRPLRTIQSSPSVALSDSVDQVISYLLQLQASIRLLNYTRGRWAAI